MDALNFSHLRYFWLVAREGGVTAASKRARVSQPTVSAQLAALEATLDTPLFERTGRRLELTDAGRVVLSYADEIFSLGDELQAALRGTPTGRARPFHVGVSDTLAKLMVHALLAPALTLEEPVRLVCREDHTERLLADLSLRELDLVLSDSPLPPGGRLRAYSHLVGECPVTLLGTPALASRYRKGFPGSLTGAPVLLPTERTVLRAALDRWFEERGLRPHVVAEFQDSATLKAFGQAGLGLFFAPAAVDELICGQYGVRRVGRLDSVRERFYAITLERRIKHPAVQLVTSAARTHLFP